MFDCQSPHESQKQLDSYIIPEALKVNMIHSVAGQLREGKLMRQRPFRDPHHSASLAAAAPAWRASTRMSHILRACSWWRR